MIYQIIVDANGVITTAIASNVVADDAIVVDEITYQEASAKANRAKWLDNRVSDLPPSQEPELPVRVYKAPMFRKMTDAEYDAYLQIRASFAPRLQAIFDAAEYLSPDDEFWADLLGAAEDAYGAERASELLAPTI